MQALTRQLQRAQQARMQGKPGLAESLCNDILRVSPGHFEATTLLGMVFLESGRFEAADAAIRSTVAMEPDQPRANMALAFVRKRLGDYDGAIDCYRAALEIAPKLVEGWFQLGLILQEVDLDDRAEKAFKTALKSDQSFSPARVSLGILYIESERLEEALSQLRRAVRDDPDGFLAYHNLGVVLRRMGETDQALEALKKSLELNPDGPGSLYIIARICREKRDFDQAITHLEKAIEVAPDYHLAHIELNKLLWDMGKEEEFLSSFGPAIAKVPMAPVLPSSQADFLLRQGRGSDAEEVIRSALGRGMSDGMLHDMLGRCLVQQEKFEEALDHHNAAVLSGVQASSWLINRAKALMYVGKYDEAILDLDPANFDRKLGSDSEQMRIAMIAQCYSEVGDPRGQIYNDYERFVKLRALPVPEGYETIEEFNKDLLIELEKLHVFDQHPIDQSLRANGSQTPGQLFERPSGIIEKLKASFVTNFQSYIDELDDDPEHPFLRSKAENIEFKGGWSVRLKDQGFHASHIHGQGWISSAYYVSLPQEVKSKASEDKRAGHIHFGRPDGLPGEDGEPRFWVEPKEGYMAMFPSYVWHGTQPFSSDAPRVTVAMDVTTK